MILLALVAQAAAPEPALKTCDLIDPGRPFVAFDTQLVRAGDTVRIKPMVSHAWFGDEEVRWDCFDDWAVSDPRLARIDTKGHVLIVTAGAPPDSDVKVSATFRQTPSVERGPVSAAVRIVARAAQVLTGTWTEASRKGCAGDSVAELIFNPRGGYSFTFSGTMVETMTSGGGAFSWDPATEALILDGRKGVATLTSWKGSAGTEPTALVIGGIDFYPRMPEPPRPGAVASPPPPCILTFRRVR